MWRLLQSISPALPWKAKQYRGRDDRMWNADLVTAWERPRLKRNGQPRKKPLPSSPECVNTSSYGVGAFNVAEATTIATAMNILYAMLQAEFNDEGETGGAAGA